MYLLDKLESNRLCHLAAQLNTQRKEKGPDRAFPPTNITHTLRLEP